jgi:predicted ester cyclase/quinol monooxygenase YgiN
MPIYTIAEYQISPSDVDKVKEAIEEFVDYVRANEPGSQVYAAWQQKEDPSRFVHFFIFQDEEAHRVHSRSDAVKRFETAYRPELSAGDVVFIDYRQVASNQPSAHEQKNKQVIREFTRIFKNQHNVDGVSHLFRRDFTHHSQAPLPPGFEGLRHVRQVGIMMNTAFPDVVVTEEDLIASGDRVVERSSAVATHKGPLMGATPTGRQVRWSEIRIYSCSRAGSSNIGPKSPCWNCCSRSARCRKFVDMAHT